jgi:hypothetical protein
VQSIVTLLLTARIIFENPSLWVDFLFDNQALADYSYCMRTTQCRTRNQIGDKKMATQIADKINAAFAAQNWGTLVAKAWTKETEHGTLERVYINRSNGKAAGFVAIKESGFELFSIDGAVLKSVLKQTLGM